MPRCGLEKVTEAASRRPIPDPKSPNGRLQRGGPRAVIRPRRPPNCFRRPRVPGLEASLRARIRPREPGASRRRGSKSYFWCPNQPNQAESRVRSRPLGPRAPVSAGSRLHPTRVDPRCDSRLPPQVRARGEAQPNPPGLDVRGFSSDQGHVSLGTRHVRRRPKKLTPRCRPVAQRRELGRADWAPQACRRHQLRKWTRAEIRRG